MPERAGRSQDAGHRRGTAQTGPLGTLRLYLRLARLIRFPENLRCIPEGQAPEGQAESLAVPVSRNDAPKPTPLRRFVPFDPLPLDPLPLTPYLTTMLTSFPGT